MKKLLGLGLISLWFALPAAWAQEEFELDEVDLEQAIEDLDLEISDVDLEEVEVDASEIATDIDPADVADNLDLDREMQAVLRGSTSGSGKLPRKVVQALYDAQPSRRASAVRSLGNSGKSMFVGSLTAALRDRSPVVRRAAADALGKVGGFESLGALREASPREKNTQTNRAIDRAIGAIEARVFAGTQGGAPVTLVCHSCGKKFCLLRKTNQGYCPYDGVPWTLGPSPAAASGSASR